MIEFVGSKEILDFATETGLKTLRMTFEDNGEDVGKTREAFNVFEVSREEFFKMCDGYRDEYDFKIEGDESPCWKDSWGWWRYAQGCNLDGVEPTIYADINGNLLKVWYSRDAMSDFIADWDEDNEPVENLIEDWIADHSKYKDIFEYCSDMWGISTERNITAVAVGLAKLNNMSLSTLFSLTT